MKLTQEERAMKLVSRFKLTSSEESFAIKRMSKT